MSSTVTLAITVYRDGETTRVELSNRRPDSAAQVAPVRGNADLQPEALLALHTQPAAYGEALTRQLFADPEVAAYWSEVETAAQAAELHLRVSLHLDRSARDLTALRWELLAHPRTGRPLALDQRLVFSRLLSSRDWDPMRIRARETVRAVVAVAAPRAEDLARARLAPVDAEAEAAPVLAALEGVSTLRLGQDGEPLTLRALEAALADGCDVLYLVCHGSFGRSGATPTVVLCDDDGGADFVLGARLAESIKRLEDKPRLVVLASCQSMGDGDPVAQSEAGTVQATLAGRLCDAGVPAVVAMQGFITMETTRKMMPVFFRELIRDGKIDRAMAAARATVEDRPDWWMPALSLRLTGGRIWYAAGFSGDQGEAWRDILSHIRERRVVPLVGPGLLDHVCATSDEIARNLAAKYRFPLAAHDWDDLPRVAQFLSVVRSRDNAVDDVSRELGMSVATRHRSWLPPELVPGEHDKPRTPRLFKALAQHLVSRPPTEPYRVLTALRAPVVVCATFDLLVPAVMKAEGLEPSVLLSRWRQGSHPSAPKQPWPRAEVDKPIVYYALGALTDRNSMVLTEDDHFEYLIQSTKGDLMPTPLQAYLNGSALLLLGFRLTDWSFRVLFRIIRNFEGRADQEGKPHVAVQVDPSDSDAADVDGARRYLQEYFRSDVHVRIFWGSVQDFLRALQVELDRTGGVDATADDDPGAEDDLDDWV